MSAYLAIDWHAFFEAAVGASAALLGLLFVSISINIQTILKYPYLPARAAATLGMLLSLLVICFFGLAPNESATTFGWETIAVASIACGQSILVAVRRKRAGDRSSWTYWSLGQLLCPELMLLGGGISLLEKSGGGIYWILFGTGFVFVSASINAWVLLVEILR
jgi:hypothetical protein